MVVPGSRRVFGRFVAPIAGRRVGVDVEAVRAGLSAAERQVGLVLVIGDPSAGELRQLGLPDPFVLVDGSLDSDGLPDAGTPIRGAPGDVPFADASLDGVVVTRIHGTSGPVDDAFAEAKRVLRPGGVLVVASLDPSTLRGRAVRTAGLLRGDAPGLLTPGEVAARMEAAGLASEITWPRWTFAVAGVRTAGSAGA